MSEIADRYRKNAAAFTECVEAVPADAWNNPSPCDEWTARDVVGHVVGTCGMFLGFINRQLPPASSVEEDPVVAFQSARDAVQGALDDPATAHQEYQGFFGTTTFESAVDTFLSPDALVHAWDLARATGLAAPHDNAEAQRILANYEKLGDNVRTAGVFGPPKPVPADADAMTTLLAFSGREP